MIRAPGLFTNIMLFCINDTDLNRLSITLYPEVADNVASIVSARGGRDSGYCINASSINYTTIGNLSINMGEYRCFWHFMSVFVFYLCNFWYRLWSILIALCGLTLF